MDAGPRTTLKPCKIIVHWDSQGESDHFGLLWCEMDSGCPEPVKPIFSK